MFITDTIDYTFQLEVFEGPLDLLLRLIEREELDITTIALAQVADAYLAHVRGLVDPNPGALSAFLLMASRLLLIKSRALLPRQPPASPDGQPDEAEQLVRQLQEYQRFKQAATLLRSWDDQGRRSYTRLAPPIISLPAPDRLDVSLAELITAVQRRMQLMLPLDEPQVTLPAQKLLTVADVAEQIRERLQHQQWIGFEDLLGVTIQRVEVIVTLWAVLEMLKRRAITVEQVELFGPIMIGKGPTLTEVDPTELDVEEQPLPLP